MARAASIAVDDAARGEDVRPDPGFAQASKVLAIHGLFSDFRRRGSAFRCFGAQTRVLSRSSSPAA